MEITEVKITLANEGQLRAFASVTIDDSFLIRDIRIIEGPNGLFVALPRGSHEVDTRLDDAQPIRPQWRRRILEDRILPEYRKVTDDDIA